MYILMGMLENEKGSVFMLIGQKGVEIGSDLMLMGRFWRVKRSIYVLIGL